MNVVYTFDNGYAEITAVSMLSLLRNNMNCKDLNLYVADCGITLENQNKLNDLAKKFGRVINYVDARNMEFRIPISLNLSYWTFTCYVRLFFSELFPTLDRVMHIDCDTIVCGSLEEAYNTNIEEAYCAGCYDCIPSTKRQAGLQKEDIYVSNGFLIFDLDKMRKDNIQEKFVNYIVEKKGNLPHLDQDVVNAVLKHRIYIMPAKYNVMTYNVLFKSRCCEFFDKDEPYYSNKEINDAVKDPKVVHLVGYRFVSKPWMQPCYHPYNALWKSYYSECKFCGDGKLLKYKRKKYGILREIVCIVWNLGRRIPGIDYLEFIWEKRRVFLKCENAIHCKEN